MALEAVVFQQDLFGSSNRELFNLVAGNWSYNDQKQEDKDGSYDFLDQCIHQSDVFLQEDDWSYNDQKQEDKDGSYDFLDQCIHQPDVFLQEDHWSSSPSPLMVPFLNNDQSHQQPNSNANGVLITSTPAATAADHDHDHHDHEFHQLDTSSTIPARNNRRRSRTRKNKEEIENQRMTHIAVERNRRKQMNEYLATLRSLMPESYVQRGDQASIIGGAINFVKELEQHLQVLGVQKELRKEKSDGDGDHVPFSEFFTFPQFSTGPIHGENSGSAAAMNETILNSDEAQSSIADIEVTMVESHANLKIRSKRRPKQLLKVVSGLHSLRFTILHLNVTTVDQTVLYSLSVKVEDDCKLTSVDEIATAVNQMLGRIQEEQIK